MESQQPILTLDTDGFRYIYHHVIFPPKLPSEPERKENPLQKELLSLLEETPRTFVQKRPPEEQEKWKPIVSMIKTSLLVDTGAVDLNRHQEALSRALKNLKTEGTALQSPLESSLLTNGLGAVATHVWAQNCGWMAHYDKERDQVIIDAFEVSATSSAVIKAAGPLIRCFPGQSVAIPAAMVDDSAFCKYLARALCQLNLEVVRQMCPKAAELREGIEEIRDTNHPGLITEGLMAQLLAYGSHSTHKSFEKHVHDDVIFGDGNLPWRRSCSSLWFVIRVAIQTILYRVFPDCEGRAEYKNFMLYFVSEIGWKARTLKDCDVAGVLSVVRTKAARRVNKLQENTLDFVLERVAEVDGAMTERLRILREKIQDAGTQVIPEAWVLSERVTLLHH